MTTNTGKFGQAAQGQTAQTRGDRLKVTRAANGGFDTSRIRHGGQLPTAPVVLVDEISPQDLIAAARAARNTGQTPG